RSVQLASAMWAWTHTVPTVVGVAAVRARGGPVGELAHYLRSSQVGGHVRVCLRRQDGWRCRVGGGVGPARRTEMDARGRERFLVGERHVGDSDPRSAG